MIGVFEQVEEELTVFLLLDALGLTGIVVVHSIDNLLEWDKFEGSRWFFVGLVNDEVEVVHEIDFFLFVQSFVEIDVLDEAELP